MVISTPLQLKNTNLKINSVLLFYFILPLLESGLNLCTIPGTRTTQKKDLSACSGILYHTIERDSGIRYNSKIFLHKVVTETVTP